MPTLHPWLLSVLPEVLALRVGAEFDSATVAAWVITAFYLAAAHACLRALGAARLGFEMSRWPRVSERRSGDRARAYRASSRFWGVIAVLLVVLAVTARLGLFDRLTDVGRVLAHGQGWYAIRRVFQTIAVTVIAVGGVVTLAVFLRRTRELLPYHLPAFISMGFLAWFLAGRSSSLHAIDAWLTHEWLGLQMGWLLETAGIFCIAYCAAVNTRWKREYPSFSERV